MKKILLSFTCVIVAIASITFITLVKSNSEELTDSLLLENVEALTRGEIGEVVITCSKSHGGGGQCTRAGMNLKYCGEYSYYECEYTGYTFDSCSTPC